eukprot:6261928-Alexandrium_andersonii.AAC.1
MRRACICSVCLVPHDERPLLEGCPSKKKQKRREPAHANHFRPGAGPAGRLIQGRASWSSWGGQARQRCRSAR